MIDQILVALWFEDLKIEWIRIRTCCDWQWPSGPEVRHRGGKGAQARRHHRQNKL